MKNELIYDLPFADYQKIGALNLSLLKEMAESAGYLEWRRHNPWEPSDAATLGSAIHALVLEPGEFDRRYVCPPSCPAELCKQASCRWTPPPFVETPEGYTGRSKADKEFRTDVEAIGGIIIKPADWGEDGLSMRSGAGQAWKRWARDKGLTVLSRTMAEQAKGASEGVLGYGPARELIDATRHEVSLVWQDPETGLWLKGRMDCWDGERMREIDLKTKAGSVAPDAIKHHAHDQRWHLQRAFYAMGIRAITGEEPAEQYIVAVSVDGPYRCEVYRLGPFELALGYTSVRTLLNRYAGWQRLNQWPLNSGDVLDIHFAPWAFNKEV